MNKTTPQRQRGLSGKLPIVQGMMLSAWEPVWAEKEHYNHSCELVHILQGREILHLDGKKYKGEAGDTLIIPIEQLHRDEFPADWFRNAKLSSARADSNLNCFGVRASQPLAVWQKKGWIWDDDPRGWFQWYCRYYMGRRYTDDERQIKRWRAMNRHAAQIRAHCGQGDLSCRRKQRQALLHWAYDSRKL